MLYSILIHGAPGVFDRLPKEEQEAVFAQHERLQAKLKKEGKLGPAAKLMPPQSAVTLRQQGSAPLLLDGPFAETKEQFFGFYIVDCADLEEAIAIAKELPQGLASYEVRQVQWSNVDEAATPS